MSDETPQDPATPDPPATPASETPATPASESPAPDPATPPVADAAANAPTVETPAPPTPPVAAAPVAPTATAKKERKSVAVPMSVLVALGAILVAALMFGIGYAVGDSNNDDAVTSQPRIEVPNFPQIPGGNQQTPNQDDSGNNDSDSDNDSQPASSPPFMGVATQQTSDGLEITEVVASSAADRAGLEVGDVITEFDGDAVTTSAQLANAVAQHDVGDEVEVTYTRDGDDDTVTVTLGTRTTSN